MLIGDRRRLRQALHHLISNAVKFTEQGKVSILADRIGDEILIAVTDSGCGLDMAGADRMFEAFVQGDDSISRTHIGAGIGLSLVQRHAALMGGSVVVDSHPGDGATFTLRLPLALAPAEAQTSAPAARPAAVAPVEDGYEPAAPRILVVDDHPVNREVARIMLQAFGCEVIEVCDGVEAVEAVQAEVFDLVLMDVRMPRMDGLEATRRIRALSGPAGELAVVAMTADAMPEDVVRCLAAGMNAHMAKPVNQAGLFDAVHRALTGALPQARVSQAA
jgi:CheY-like chemotaxis protein/anti-sigma regulatory factor (Ser/Thr protein kinase)